MPRGWFGSLQSRETAPVPEARRPRPAAAARSRVCGKSVPAAAVARPIIGNGPMPSSRSTGYSPFRRPMEQRDTSDEEASDRRAVCGRTGSEGGEGDLPDPYRSSLRLSASPAPGDDGKRIVDGRDAVAYAIKNMRQRGRRQTGRHTRARKPPNGESSSEISPPCARTMSRAIVRPRPVPPVEPL